MRLKAILIPVTICVFCGARAGTNREFVEVARQFGTILGQRGHALIYGGGNVGLMGTVADAALSAGSLVTGVIPKHLVERELAHGGLDRLETVATMHERKARMHQLSDAFVALPGGIGTLEELTEVISWSEMGILNHPVALLNVLNYWDGFLSMVREMAKRGMASRSVHDSLIVERTPGLLLDRIEGSVASPDRVDSD